jgi:hypothetical protein
MERFFEDAERRASEMPDEAQINLTTRLAEARQLLGGLDPLGHFASWTSPHERVGPAVEDADSDDDALD